MNNQGDKYHWTQHLVLKKRWFDMILSGEKKEEYRDITSYWTRRLIGDWQNYQQALPIYKGYHLMPFGVDRICFRNGYQKDARRLVIKWESISVGCPKPGWCPRDTDVSSFVFVLKLGEIIEKSL